MGELWIAATVGAVGAYASSRSASSQKKEDQKNTIAQMQEEGRQRRMTTEFEMGMADYYSQMNKQRRRDARAAHFASFSKRPQPAGYTRPNIVPDKPVNPDTQAQNNQPRQVGTSGRIVSGLEKRAG